MLALPDQFLPQGKATDILRDNGLDAAGVAKSVFEAVRGKITSEKER
jgi:deoxyxylulose-5-phosphate synthase